MPSREHRRIAARPSRHGEMLWLALVLGSLATAAAVPLSGQSSGRDLGGAGDEPVWYDCSQEEGISKPVLQFSDVFSVPAVVTKNSGQVVHKTVHYNGSATVPTIAADFHQFYRLFDVWWTFLSIKNVNLCHEHPELCPIKAGETVNLTSVHPPLNPLTPYGWYRSRQVFRNQFTGAKMACVDMRFQYREA